MEPDLTEEERQKTHWWCPACEGHVRLHPTGAPERCGRRVLSVTTTASGTRRMREVCGAAVREAPEPGLPLVDQWTPGVRHA